MTTYDPAYFHKIHGVKKPRVTYYRKDFLDYSLMIAVTAVVIGLVYGPTHPVAVTGFVLCAFCAYAFAARHGMEWTVPLIARRPQDVLYMIFYKIENLPALYFVAVAVLLLENILILVTPRLPHHVELMRTAGLTLFYVHLLGITAYRTVILVDHLRKRELAREILMQTPWKRVITEKTNITREILHAYATGLLTHIVHIAPWYLVITLANFSLVFLPLVCAINVFVHRQWVRRTNLWFYRDHWLGHNSELEFLFLHGPHHDAIPSGLIGVAGNGFLEGFARGTLGFPNPFYNPLVACVMYTVEIKQDIDLHQYIPGIFPRLPKRTLEIGQHATHHYGRLEPYSIGLKLDQPGVSEEYKKNFRHYPEEWMNSIRMDEALTDFQWDNPTHRHTLSLWDKYQR